METVMLNVVVVIAVNEDGVITSSIQDDCRLNYKRKHEEWLQQLRQDSKFWTLKTIRTEIPMPVQYEEQIEF